VTISRRRPAVADKGVALDLDALLALDGEVRAMKTRADGCAAERNAISDGFKSAAPEERPALGAGQGDRRGDFGVGSRARREAGGARRAAAARAQHPLGGRADRPGRDVQHRRAPEGDVPDFDFEPLDHVALVEKNDWADLARITQVAGSRTYCLKGRLAMLEQALMLWAQQRLAADGFTLMTVPALARPQAFVATGHFPGHEEEAYADPGRRSLPCRHRRDRLTSLHSGE
jgi:seryl-tRNA synthetase